MKGGLAIRRGIGSAVRPPAVWVNLTQPSPRSGSPTRSGKPTAAKVTPSDPSRTVVEPITPPPAMPQSTGRSPSKSAQPVRRLANRNRSSARSLSRSSTMAGGGSS
jgi:hypothetical protein